MRKIPNSYRVEEKLPDGQPVRVRAIRPDDRDRLHEEFLKLSKSTVRDRFFGTKMDLTPRELTFYTQVDFISHVALVAEVAADGAWCPVGVGRFVRDRERPDHSEFAITITDEFQGRGIGKLLLQHLIRCARKLGVRYLDASVLPQNVRMSGLLHRSGLPLQSSLKDGILTYSLTLEPGWTRRARDAIMARLRRARGGESGANPPPNTSHPVGRQRSAPDRNRAT
jgi:GNAT superfamily N-acetyltransferase